MDSVTARRVLLDCFRLGVAAVDPENAVGSTLAPIPGRVVVLALGKAGPAMARGAARGLGRDRLEGIVVGSHRDTVPDGLELLLGSHPIPDESSEIAGRALLSLAGTLGEGDTAVVLISGGGSALAEVPIKGVTIDDLSVTTMALLRSGADINEVNTVRRRLSRIKGGGLAAAIAPARLVTLAVSDVVGDDPAAIASGPTFESHDEPEAASTIVRALGLEPVLPDSVMNVLGAPQVSARSIPASEFKIVAGAAEAAHAAAVAGERHGIPSRVLDTRMTGDAGAMAGEALQRAGSGLSVFAGETTVDVRGDGIGGRNHEAALVAATLIEGQRGVWFFAGGTDGIDGMTDAAGVVVDGKTIARAEAIGLDAGLALEHNDSGGYFTELGEQIRTGPTGTNVGDLWLVLRD